MSNKRSSQFTKHSVRLRAGDMAAIQAAHPSIGANEAIRRKLSAWVDTLRAGSKPAEVEVDLPTEEPTNA